MPRLAKESFYRNSIIRKNYHQFVKQFEPFSTEVRKIQDENTGFMSVKQENKIQLRVRKTSQAKNDLETFKVKKPVQRTLHNVDSFMEHPRMKSNQGKIKSFLLKLSEFKTYDSEQLQAPVH